MMTKKDDDVMGREGGGAAIQGSGMCYLLHHAIINRFFATIMLPFIQFISHYFFLPR